MKSIINTRNVRRLAVVASITALFILSTLAQPNPDSRTAEFTSSARLEEMANVTEQSLRYIAPASLPGDDVDAALQDLERLALAIEYEIQYKASENGEQLVKTLIKPIRATHQRRYRPVQVELSHSMQDVWLINAGYYKSTRIPTWNKVRKAFRPKSNDKEFAIEF